MKPKLKAPATKRLKLKHDELVSGFAFNFDLLRYNKVECGVPDIAFSCTGECTMCIYTPSVGTSTIPSIETDIN